MFNFLEVKSELTKKQLREFELQKFSLFAATDKAGYSVEEALRRALLICD